MCNTCTIANAHSIRTPKHTQRPPTRIHQSINTIHSAFAPANGYIWICFSSLDIFGYVFPLFFSSCRRAHMHKYTTHTGRAIMYNEPINCVDSYTCEASFLGADFPGSPQSVHFTQQHLRGIGAQVCVEEGDLCLCVGERGFVFVCLFGMCSRPPCYPCPATGPHLNVSRSTSLQERAPCACLLVKKYKY